MVKKKRSYNTICKEVITIYLIIFPPFRFDLWTIYLVSLPAKWMSPQRTEIISSTLWTSRNMELLENGTAPYRRYLILFGGEFCLFANQNSVRHGRVHYCEAPKSAFKNIFFRGFSFLHFLLMEIRVSGNATILKSFVSQKIC